MFLQVSSSPLTGVIGVGGPSHTVLHVRRVPGLTLKQAFD
jgi:hypothetical protein